MRARVRFLRMRARTEFGTLARMLRLIAVSAAVLLGLVACNSKEFNESFCASYKDSFVKSCTDTCASKSGQREACGTQCKAALPKDTTFSGRCKDTAAGKAVYAGQ